MTEEEFNDLPALKSCPGKPACDQDCLCQDHRDIYRWMQGKEAGWRDSVIAAREARDKADLEIAAMKPVVQAAIELAECLAKNRGEEAGVVVLLNKVTRYLENRACDCLGVGEEDKGCTATTDQGMLFCTRPRDHEPPHRACGGTQHGMKEWTC